MFCRLKSKRIIPVILIIVGAISLVYGLVAYQTAPTEAENYSHFLGMLTGFGSGLAGVGLFTLLRARFMSPEKRKQQEIDQNDERNVAIHRAAFTVSALAAILLFTGLAFAFIAMGYRLPGYLCIGAMYVQILVYLVAAVIFRKKM